MDVHHRRSAGFYRAVPAALLPGIAALASLEGAPDRGRRHPQRHRAHRIAQWQKAAAAGACVIPPLGNQTRWQELFQGRYLSRTFLVWILWAASYIIAYGLAGWIPTLYREVYHLPLQQALNYSIAGPAGSLLGSAICAFMIDWTGRRYWFTAAFFLTAAGLIELWAYGSGTALGMLLGYGFCQVWLGSMNMSIFLYTAEIYPTRMRALGVSWASFWLRMAATVGPLIVGFALPRYGIGGVFLAFSIFAIIGCGAATYMIETRRRVLEEVSP